MVRTNDVTTIRVLALLAGIAVVGCDQGPQMVTVSGVVSLDGDPLDDATVEFDPGDGTPPKPFDITAGRFSGEVVVGPKTVRFFALRPSKPNRRLGPTDVLNPFENILPHRYGYDSTMTIEVTPDSSTGELSYELTSK